MYIYKRQKDGSRSIASYHIRDINEAKPMINKIYLQDVEELNSMQIISYTPVYRRNNPYSPSVMYSPNNYHGGDLFISWDKRLKVDTLEAYLDNLMNEDLQYTGSGLYTVKLGALRLYNFRSSKRMHETD